MLASRLRSLCFLGSCRRPAGRSMYARRSGRPRPTNGDAGSRTFPSIRRFSGRPWLRTSGFPIRRPPTNNSRMLSRLRETPMSSRGYRTGSTLVGEVPGASPGELQRIALANTPATGVALSFRRAHGPSRRCQRNGRDRGTSPYSRGSSTLIVTHRQAVTQLADRVVTLSEGRFHPRSPTSLDDQTRTSGEELVRAVQARASS